MEINKDNKENMEVVKNLIEQADRTRLAGDIKEGVHIDYTSADNNQYTGLVVFKRPTMKDFMRMGAIKSEILRLSGVVDVKFVDDSIKQMALVMATLKVVVVKYPEWLAKLDDIEEPDLLFHVYDKYEEWLDSFRKPSEGELKRDSESSERKETVDTP